MLKYLRAQIGTLHSPLGPAIETTHLVRTRTDMGHTRQALGWLVTTLPNVPHAIIWHNGGTGGYQSWAGFVKEKGIGVVVLGNFASTSATDLIGFAITTSLDRQATSAPASAPGVESPAQAKR